MLLTFYVLVYFILQNRSTGALVVSSLLDFLTFALCPPYRSVIVLNLMGKKLRNIVFNKFDFNHTVKQQMDFSSTLCWKWLQILVGTFSNYFRYIKCILQLSGRSRGPEGCATLILQPKLGL